MSVEQNLGTLDDAVAAWNARDYKTYLELYAPSIVHHGLGPEPFGPEENRGFYEVIWAAFPGSQLTIDDSVGAEDQIAARFHLQGEHQGEFTGIAATGNPFILSGQTIPSFGDGKVVERWTVTDMFGLMVQLGVIESPS